MSQFEYLNRISIGQYLPIDSPIHQRNPAIKLACTSILVLAIALSKQFHGLLFSLIFLLLLLILSKTPFKYALRGMLTPLPFIFVIALIQLFLASHRSIQTPLFSWWFFSVTLDGILNAVSLFLRFIALVWLLTIASATISTLEMVYGLDILSRSLQIIGIRSGSAAMVMQIMLRFIPILALSAEKIAKSQASRGALWDSHKGGLIQRIRQVLPLIVPLFTVSLQQADTLANAMLARAYGSAVKRTGLYQYHLDLADGLFFLVTLIVSFLILYFPFT